MVWSAQADTPQATYRFKWLPEFLLLGLYPEDHLFGYTASLLDKRINNVVIGKPLSKGSMQLSMYPIAAYNVATKKFTEAGSQRGCKDDIFDVDGTCRLLEVMDNVPSSGFPAENIAIYSYKKIDPSGRAGAVSWPTPTGEWKSADEEGAKKDYSVFFFVSDNGLAEPTEYSFRRARTLRIVQSCIKYNANTKQ